jgi:hypothetical protein
MNERIKFKEGKMLGNLDGLGHYKGGKTNQRDIIKGQECIKFVSNGDLEEDEYMPSAQNPEVPRQKCGGSGVWKPRTTRTAEPGGFGEIPGGSGVCNSRTENGIKAQPKQVPKTSNSCLQIKDHPIMPKRNKVAHKNMAHASTDIPPSYVLRRNNLGKVVTTYVGNQSNIYVKRLLWVPKVLVANVEGPKSNWGPKRSN